MSADNIVKIPTLLNIFGPAPNTFNVLVLEVGTETLVESKTGISLVKAANMVRTYHEVDTSSLPYAGIILDGVADGHSIVLYPPANNLEIWISVTK